LLNKWNRAPNRGFSFYVQAIVYFETPLNAQVLLVRHGSHDEVGRLLSGRSGIVLNATGYTEVARLSAYLVDFGVSAVFSSPRPRAVETAWGIAAALDLEVDIEPGLDEIDFGAWTGRAFADLESDPEWQHWNQARGSARVPGGETMAEVTSRAVEAVERIAGLGGTIACVSHCDVIRALVAHYLGLDLDRLLSFDVDPASISIIALGNGAPRVVAVNRNAA